MRQMLRPIWEGADRIARAVNLITLTSLIILITATTIVATIHETEKRREALRIKISASKNSCAF